MTAAPRRGAVGAVEAVVVAEAADQGDASTAARKGAATMTTGGATGSATNASSGSATKVPSGLKAKAPAKARSAAKSSSAGRALAESAEKAPAGSTASRSASRGHAATATATPGAGAGAATAQGNATEDAVTTPVAPAEGDGAPPSSGPPTGRARGSGIGEFIREQRRNSRLSVRRLSQMAQVSNPYLSQIERGLRRPSADILQQLAKALRISAETLYVQAGMLDEREPTGDLAVAIWADPALTDPQKQALAQILRSFQLENAEAARRP